MVPRRSKNCRGDLQRRLIGRSVACVALEDEIARAGVDEAGGGDRRRSGDCCVADVDRARVRQARSDRDRVPAAAGPMPGVVEPVGDIQHGAVVENQSCAGIDGQRLGFAEAFARDRGRPGLDFRGRGQGRNPELQSLELTSQSPLPFHLSVVMTPSSQVLVDDRRVSSCANEPLAVAALPVAILREIERDARDPSLIAWRRPVLSSADTKARASTLSQRHRSSLARSANSDSIRSRSKS